MQKLSNADREIVRRAMDKICQLPPLRSIEELREASVNALREATAEVTPPQKSDNS